MPKTPGLNHLMEEKACQNHIDHNIINMDVKIVGVLSYFPLESAYIRGMKRYNDIVEIRADLIGDNHTLAIEKFSKIKPILLTVRSEKEGGAFVPSRKKIYLQNMDKAEFIDIELSSVDEMGDVLHEALSRRKKVILSYHSFDSLPKERELDRMFQKAELHNASMFKAAFFARSHNMIIELSMWLRKATLKRTTEVSLMCMGDPKISLLSRIVFSIFGSRLVYGRLGKSSAAPGQPDSFTLYKILKEERYT